MFVCSMTLKKLTSQLCLWFIAFKYQDKIRQDAHSLPLAVFSLVNRVCFHKGFVKGKESAWRGSNIKLMKWQAKR